MGERDYERTEDGSDGVTLNYKLSNLPAPRAAQRLLGQGTLAHSAAAIV
jgi:hypothetical protein